MIYSGAYIREVIESSRDSMPVSKADWMEDTIRRALAESGAALEWSA